MAGGRHADGGRATAGGGEGLHALIHVGRRLFENLRADRHRPPVERLGAITEAERFVWRILPYAARSFSFCIAVLPPRTARPLAVAYLYCRMLDTCEDLPAGAAEKEAKLTAFLARFDEYERRGAPPGPPPTVEASRACDVADRVHLPLPARGGLVDRLFLALPSPPRAVILRL